MFINTIMDISDEETNNLVMIVVGQTACPPDLALEKLIEFDFDIIETIIRITE